MDHIKLRGAIKHIALGYILLHFNINLGTLNILPNWLGYALFLHALPALSKEEESAGLLRPLGILLALWQSFLWVEAIFSVQLEIEVLEVIAGVISLYFHFQLLTNLADIAAKYDCPQHKRILMLRTVRTVLETLFAFILRWQEYPAVSIAMFIIYIFVTFWICSILFSLRRSLTPEQPELPET